MANIAWSQVWAAKWLPTGVKEDVVQCTQLIAQGSEQLLILEYP